MEWKNYSQAFSKKSKLSISLDKESKILYSLYCIASLGLSKCIETKP